MENMPSIGGIMGLLALVAMFCALVYGCYLSYLSQQRQRRFFQNSVRDKLQSIFDELDVDKFRFYTTGHPYVWVSSSKEDMVDNIQASCEKNNDDGLTYYGPARYSLKVDKDNFAIYYTTSSRDYDFSRLMHYQEWLNSEEETKKNIEAYKARSQQ